MEQILRIFRDEGEDALMRAVAFLGASLIGVAALVTFAAALVAAATLVMPLYAALFVGSIFLTFVAALMFLALRNRRATAAAGGGARKAANGFDQPAYEALVANASAQPGKTMLAGLVAGVTLGVLDSFDRRR